MPTCGQQRAFCRQRLARGETLRLEGAGRLRIVCQQGQLWLTQYGDSRDIILAAGEGFTVEQSAAVVISALQNSLASVGEAPAGANCSRRRVGVWLRACFRGRWQSASNARFRAGFSSCAK